MLIATIPAYRDTCVQTRAVIKIIMPIVDNWLNYRLTSAVKESAMQRATAAVVYIKIIRGIELDNYYFLRIDFKNVNKFKNVERFIYLYYLCL